MPPKATKKKPTTRKRKVSAKKVAHFGSKVGNGTSLFLDGSLDQRSLAARRYREITYSIGSDLGGFAGLSEFEKQLTRRSAALAVLCELDECRIAKGEEIDAGRFATMANALNRLGQSLGTKRVVLDVTPSLQTLLAQKAEEEAQEADQGEEAEGVADGEG
jgi:hypothetical protein